MKIQEAVYTSASELLEDSTGHLGIVAKSRGIPQDVEIELRAHRAYSLLPELSVDATATHPPRFIVSTYGNGSAFLGVTRIVFAGADHTGRTTPLVHHLLVSRAELNGVRPSEFVAATKESYLSRWNGQAHWIDPPRELAAGSRGTPGPGCLEEIIGSGPQLIATLSCIAESLVGFPITRRSVVVCIPRSAGTLGAELIALILDTLPSSLQFETHCVSHVIAPTDQPRGFSLALTYPGTACMKHNAERQDERRAVVLDLTRIESLPKVVEGTYATLFAQAFQSDGMRGVRDLSFAWDEFGLDSTMLGLFPALMELRAGLAGNTLVKPGSVNKLATLLGDINATEPLQRPVEEKCLAAVQRLGEYANPSRWETLAIIGGDERWPKAARNCCLDFICLNNREALVHIASLQSKGTQASSNLTDAHLEKCIVARPQLIGMAIEYATSTQSPADIDLVSRLLKLATLRFDEVCKLLSRILPLATKANDTLLSSCQQMTQRSIKSLDHIVRLCALMDTAHHNSLMDQVCLRILTKSLKQVRDHADWQKLSQLYINIGLQQGHVDEHVKWLLSNCRDHLSDETINRWLANVQGDTHLADLHYVLDKFQLIPAPPVVGTTAGKPLPALSLPRTLTISAVDRLRDNRTNPKRYPVTPSGPKLLPRIVGTLTLLIGIGLSVYLILYRGGGLDLLPIWLPLLPPILFWLAAEVVLRVTIRRPEWFWIARAVRWGVTIVMMLVLCSLVVAFYLVAFSSYRPWL